VAAKNVALLLQKHIQRMQSGEGSELSGAHGPPQGVCTPDASASEK
jgi:hypothetical protein